MYLLYVIVCIIALIAFKIWQFMRHKARVDKLSDRFVFITGCDTGFGFLLARALDSKGVPVFAGCLTENGAKTLMSKSSSRLQCLQIDVTDKTSVLKAAEIVKSKLPASKGLWALVNNAGVMPNFCPSEWLRIEEYQATCKVNLFGTISVTLAFLPLIRQSKGRVVNVGSVTGFTALPGTTDYCVSKTGVRMFTACLRRELFNSGVGVHLVEPGGFGTDITNVERLRTVFERAYNRLNDDVRSFYGGTIVKKVYRDFVNAPQIYQNPKRVSGAMEDAVLSAHPNQNYLVGYDALFLFKPLALLPEWVGDYLFGWPQPYGTITFKTKKQKLLNQNEQKQN